LFAKRVLTKEELSDLLTEFKEAEADILNKDSRLAQLMDRTETKLTLLGASAVEDKLQDQVIETLRHLKAGGIKVWIMTGDKFETAENVATACGLIDSSVQMLKSAKDVKCL
jgi:P-type E1-E2 ATPase